ncbi:hypothetical protein M407DRAFT_174706 [Tulasnella calospora MUT 4182]|uniref:Uncharacterized protein n=1 Tax=Tulasnella calospora MUT 4182 TaxID=1051891 RepID=A0A0C3QME4_9AGAM|nr:hypothetical protein M407DRAFT_174706 [Tulasnella calospora MUT 4182]
MEEEEIDEMLRLLGRGEKPTEDGAETLSESSTKRKAPAGSTNTRPPKPYVYRGSRIGKMLASSTYAQTVLPEESKRLAALEAFVARAAEVQLTDCDGEFDGQLVREIVGLREVTNPIDFHDAEAKRTLELAEELSRDLLAFQEKYGPGNSFVPTARRERTAREAAAVARHRMTGESDSEE